MRHTLDLLPFLLLALGAEARAAARAVEGLQEGGAVDLSAVRVPAGQGVWVVWSAQAVPEAGFVTSVG